MSTEWTKAQQDAIDARGGTLLVSAAAGSGKTAVLVERVIKQITSTVNPCSVDKLLVVTFTKAAAAEMRSRLCKAIDEVLINDKNNKALLKQKMLLPYADISTIDSFCNDLVKQNFYKLGIEPDFQILSEENKKSLMRDVVNKIIAERYSKPNKEVFLTLSQTIGDGKNDDRLADEIINLYEYTRAFPFSEKWLEKQLSAFDSNIDIEKSEWGRVVLEYIKSAIEYCMQIQKNALKNTDEEVLLERYVPAILLDYCGLEKIYGLTDERAFSWDKLRDAVLGFKNEKVKALPKGYDSEQTDLLKEVRSKVDKVMKKIKGFMPCTEAEFKEDIESLYLLVKELFELVNAFSDEIGKEKAKISSYDFSDIEHFALDLLVEGVDEATGEPIKTELAKMLSAKYQEIYIDEFQDTNEAQNMLFKALSNNNLFMVGDVKQSIYGFRQAMPEIFTAMKDEFDFYNSKNPKYPAKIYLDKNFRSTFGIISMVNFFFKKIMSNEYGGIDYNYEEELVPNDENKQGSDSDVEFLFVQGDKLQDCDDMDKDEIQARVISEYIKNEIKSGKIIKTKTGERRVSFKDFAIILRGKKNVSKYAEVLNDNGVPAFANVTGSLFETKEISYIISLLKVIDNPLQDIPLMSVMLSPLYSFTTDDIAKIRCENKNIPLYSSVLQYRNEDKRFDDFINNIEYLRSLSATYRTDEIIRKIYYSTEYEAMVQAMGDAQQRKANLQLLLENATDFESRGYKGLSAFLCYIEKIQKEKSNVSAACVVSENADVVKVMTIHSSKGLEFPYCIIGNCANSFGNSKSTVKLNTKYGIGLKRIVNECIKAETMPSLAVKLAQKKADISEELRIFYVAMTRARNKLVFVSFEKNLEKQIKDIAMETGNAESAVQQENTVLSKKAKRNFLFKIIDKAKGFIDANLYQQIDGFYQEAVEETEQEEQEDTFAEKKKKSIELNKFSPFFVGECKKYSDWLIAVALQHKDADILRKISAQYVNVEKSADFNVKFDIIKSLENLSEENQEKKVENASEEEINLIKEKADFKYKYSLLSEIPTKRAASEKEVDGIDLEFFAHSKPAFLNEKKLTPAQIGSATHKFMQYVDFKNIDKLDEECERLFENGMLTESEKKAVAVDKVERFFESDLAKEMLSADSIHREYKFANLEKLSSFYNDIPCEMADEEILIQGIADCVFVKDNKIIIVDYKTDKVKSENELIKRYTGQIKTYSKALTLCFEMPVEKTVLYSFALDKAVEVK
ncbi:MAG: UvrD-helicase domain-containing protein [Clostridiales bacterium]|nr:UvrD-helicase domain-containing protein [Clostridiales bacterium]